MERTIKAKHLAETFWSLAEYADTADQRADEIRRRINDGDMKSWSGDVESWNHALTLARMGWTDQLPDAMAIAESAIETAEKDQILTAFNPVWDVSGAEVDVARYLAGEPENMIDFPPAHTSKVGRIVTLVVSMAVSGSISAETIRKRGQVIVALALALNRLGHAVEIWVDMNLEPARKGSGTFYQRILVKGANDELDAARVMFSCAHPAMLRVVGFGAWEGLPATWKEYGSGCRGIPGKRHEADKALFPEGTIFLPEIRSSHDIPDADKFLEKYLGELGLLPE